MENNNFQLYNIKQLAYKTAANSIYGYLGNKHSRFYIPELAETITTQGVELISTVQQLLIENGYNVIYGDTDSCFISLGDKIPDEIKQSNDDNKIIQWIDDEVNNKIYPLIDDHLNKLSRKIGIIYHESYFGFKKEIIAKKGLFLNKRGSEKESAKKRYILWIVNENGIEKDELFLRGVEIRRSELPVYIKNFLYKWVSYLLRGEDKEILLNELKEFKNNLLKEINNKNIENITKTVSLTKSVKEYAVQSYHIKAINIWNNCISKIYKLPECNVGSKVKILFIKPKFNFPINNDTKKMMKYYLEMDGDAIALPETVNKLPDEFYDCFDIDTQTVIKKLFLDQIEQYLNIMNVDMSSIF
jgi:DNA polymerase elongation subunit (family B)